MVLHCWSDGGGGDLFFCVTDTKKPPPEGSGYHLAASGDDVDLICPSGLLQLGSLLWIDRLLTRPASKPVSRHLDLENIFWE